MDDIDNFTYIYQEREVDTLNNQEQEAIKDQDRLRKINYVSDKINQVNQYPRAVIIATTVFNIVRFFI